MIYLVFASHEVRLIDCPIGDPFLGEDCQDALSACRILGTDYMNHVVRFLRKAAFLFLVWKISAKVICSVFVEIDWGKDELFISLFSLARWPSEVYGS
jgi:hypothetical protein